MPFAAGNYWSYVRARKFVRSLRITSAVDYQRWAAGKLPGWPSRPKEVPSNPHQIYRGEWQGYGDWLGTGRVANFNRRFLPYDQARAFVSRLGLETYEQWRSYCAGYLPRLGKRPAHIPSTPSMVYKKSGWCGIKHWLGVGSPSFEGVSRMRSFEDARSFARSLGLSGQRAWREYVNGKNPDLPPRPADVPSMPNVTYKGDGWAGYGDFLGTGNVSNYRKTIRPFIEARTFARSLGFRTLPQWRAWARTVQRPNDIPANPEKTYSAKWRGWKDWLRTPYVRVG